MRPISVALAIADSNLREEIGAELSAASVRVVLKQNRVEPLQLVRVNLDLVILDHSAGEKIGDVIARVKAAAPGAAVAIVSRDPDGQSILDAMRAGADDYILPPFGERLQKALDHVMTVLATREMEGRLTAKVIGVASAKGGCGATSVACHMAVALARSANADVLLADCDFETGLAGFLTKAKTQYSFLDALKNVHRLDASLWKGYVATVRPRLDVIPAPVATVTDPPAAEDYRHVFRLLRSNYGWIVADLGRGFVRTTAHMLEEMDEFVLVSTPQIPAVFHAKQVVQRLLDEGFPKERIRFVLNRMPRSGDDLAGEIEKVLGVPVAAEFSERPELDKAYVEGKLLDPESSLGGQFDQFALRLAGIHSPERSRGWSLFGLRKPATIGI